MKDIYFLDTFTGMAGLRIGVSDALKAHGYNPVCVKSVEIKKHALETVQHLYPDEETSRTDITQLDTATLPHIDGLIGGFPCQTFSTAGKQAGFEDTRGTLFYELARIMRDKQPKWCIFENVKGLVKHDGGHTLTVILRTFNDLGYYVSFQMMDAKDYGLAGSRPRIYIVCTRNKPVDLYIPPQPRIPFSNIKEELAPEWSTYTKLLLNKYTVDELRGRKIGDKKKGRSVINSWQFSARGEVTPEQTTVLEYLLNYQTSSDFNKTGKTIPLPTLTARFGGSVLPLLKELERMEYIRANESTHDSSVKGYRLIFGQLSGQFTHIIDERQPLPTLTATDGDRMAVIEGDGIRGISISEALKALGFPDNYTFPEGMSDSNKYDLLGNTVAPPVVQKVMDEIITQGGLE